MSRDDMVDSEPGDRDKSEGPKIGPPGMQAGESVGGMAGGAEGGWGQRRMRGSYDQGQGVPPYVQYDADFYGSSGERLWGSTGRERAYGAEETYGGMARDPEGPYGGYLSGGYGARGGGWGYRPGGFNASSFGGMGRYGAEYDPEEYARYRGYGYRSSLGSGEYGGYAGYGRTLVNERGMDRDRSFSGGMYGGGGERIHAERLMTQDPRSIPAETTLADAAAVLVEQQLDSIPVVGGAGDRTLRGMLTTRDVVRAVARRMSPETPVLDLVDPLPHTIQRFDGIEEMRAVLWRSRAERLPVVDREGRLVGILATADLKAWGGEGGGWG